MPYPVLLSASLLWTNKLMLDFQFVDLCVMRKTKTKQNKNKKNKGVQLNVIPRNYLQMGAMQPC